MANYELDLTPMDALRAATQQELALIGLRDGTLTPEEALIYFINATMPETVEANRGAGQGDWTPLENTITAVSNGRGLGTQK